MAYFADSPPPSSPRSVVVTGTGIVSPMGLDWAENVAAFRAGRSAFSPVTLFDVSRQRVGTAGQVALPDVMPSCGISRKAWSRMDRGSRLAWWAAHEALASAGLSGGAFPLIIGTSAAAMPIGEDYYKQAHATSARSSIQLRRVEMYQAQRQMTDMARELGVTGPIRIISNACASGANAIGHAFHLVRSGKAERVLGRRI